MTCWVSDWMLVPCSCPEYPASWVHKGRAWNEDYMLRAFLSYNAAFEIVLFNSYLTRQYPEWFAEHMPLCLKNPGASLWIRRCEAEKHPAPTVRPGGEPHG